MFDIDCFVYFLLIIFWGFFCKMCGFFFMFEKNYSYYLEDSDCLKIC